MIRPKPRAAWLLWLAIFGAALCVGQMAFAYILPARFVLRRMLERREKIRQLKVHSTTTVWSNGQKKVYEETLYLRKPGQIRLERREQGTLVEATVWRQQDMLVWRTGQTAQTSKRTPQPRFDFLAVSSQGASYGSLWALLRGLRVRYSGAKLWDRDSDYREQTNVSLAWFAKRPAYVFGAAFGEQKQNQFWIDKAALYPVRFLGHLGTDAPRIDVRFLDYYVDHRGYTFPGRTEVYEGNKLVLQALAYRVQTNLSLPDRLFSQIP